MAAVCIRAVVKAVVVAVQAGEGGFCSIHRLHDGAAEAGEAGPEAEPVQGYDLEGLAEGARKPPQPAAAALLISGRGERDL